MPMRIVYTNQIGFHLISDNDNTLHNMVPLLVYQCFYIAHYWVVAKVYMYKVYTV